MKIKLKSKLLIKKDHMKQSDLETFHLIKAMEMIIDSHVPGSSNHILTFVILMW